MRQIAIFAALLIAAGVFVARFADQTNRNAAPSNAMTAAPATSAKAPEPQQYGRTHVVMRDNRGHFSVDGRVDGRHMKFMVDTGASVIAMRESDARRLGLHPAPRDYTAEVKTANGNIRAAPATLRLVEIGGLQVRDVRALLIPDQALSENLLGLSFLSRLRRFEFSNGKLVMEQ
jgi:aspartyl protease family protein